MVKKHHRYSDKSSRSIIKKRKKKMIWGDIVNNDEYFMELNEDGTPIKCSACNYANAKNRVIVRMRHPFTTGAWNYHKEYL